MFFYGVFCYFKKPLNCFIWQNKEWVKKILFFYYVYFNGVFVYFNTFVHKYYNLVVHILNNYTLVQMYIFFRGLSICLKKNLKYSPQKERRGIISSVKLF